MLRAWMQLGGFGHLLVLSSSADLPVERYLSDLASGARRAERAAQPTSLDIQAARLESGVARLALRGELDLGSFSAAREAASQALQQAEVVELDLSGVSFVDSSGVSWLVGLHRDAVAAGGQVRVLAASSAVEHVLSSLSLERLIAAA